MTRNQGNRLGVLAILLVGCTGLLGCGTSDYEAAIAKGVAAGPQDPAQALYAEGTKLAGNLSVRIPQMFVTPARLEQPPFVDLPNLIGTYEVILPGDEALPIYCYLVGAQIPIDDQRGIEQKVVSQLKHAFPPEKFFVERLEVPTPDGGKTTWGRVTIKADQQFQGQSIPGTFDLWIHEGDSLVMLGWRWPDKALSKAPIMLTEVPRIVAGTLAGGGAAPPAAK